MLTTIAQRINGAMAQRRKGAEAKDIKTLAAVLIPGSLPFTFMIIPAFKLTLF
jgi:hypothetical protein